MNTATQTLYTPLTIATAPEASKPILEKIQKSYGFIPNLMATFANSPAVLQGYLAMDGVFEKGTFSPIERQLILLAASEENNCNYCAAAHSTIAKGFLHAPAETIAAVREGKPLADRKQNALVNLVREIVRERGFASPSTVDAFLEAGYRRPQVMELLLGVALKTVSNYLDHLSPTTIDQAFAAEARQELPPREDRTITGTSKGIGAATTAALGVAKASLVVHYATSGEPADRLVKRSSTR